MGTIGGKNYVQANDIAFCEQVRTVYSYAELNHKRWGIEAPDEAMTGRLLDLTAKVQRCQEATRSTVDTLAKNEARKTVEKEFRGYVQGVIARNVKVTNEDRKMMGLPIYDTIPTPVGDPQGLVTATVRYVQEGALELNIKHIAGTPFDKRANYGVKIRCTAAPSDAPPVTEAKDMQDSRFSRKKKELFTFEKKDAKKTAYFCLRYENSKGKAGQWGPVISAVIP